MGKTGSSPDLYELLGVAKDASVQDIKRAFRVLARECHPDVAGNDPAMAEKFKKVREAYEVLSDPVQRARYDRRGERRANPFADMWNRGSVNVGAGGPPPGGARTAANDLDLEDIFNDFGVGDFGFTGQTRGQPGSPPRRPTPPPPAHGARGRDPRASSGPPPRAARATPTPGRDIPLAVDVPADIAMRGGTVAVAYPRLRRADDGRTLYRYDELYDLKVPPGTHHGETLRVPGMGDAGMDGGPFGDLVVDVRVTGRAADARSAGARAAGAGVREAGAGWDPDGRDDGAPAGGRMKMPRREAAAEGESRADVVRVDVGVVEALLGGRVAVETPGGPVRVSIPPGTSSGTRLRLRGRGPAGPDGTPGDLFAEVRIVVPKDLDDESRSLIERFAVLNPTG
jgi:curved DNA-binding protein